MQNNNTSAFISSKKDIVKFDPSKKHKKNNIQKHMALKTILSGSQQAKSVYCCFSTVIRSFKAKI